MESIILDNGIEYLIIDTEVIDGTSYTLFSNIDNNSDICLRKTEVIDGDECYVGLDDDNEIDKVLLHFTKKNIKIDKKFNLIYFFLILMAYLEIPL